MTEPGQPAPNTAQATEPGTPATLKRPPSALQKLWKELLEPIVFAIVITQFVATLVGVDGVSMMPNLRDHERVFVPKYETWLHKAGVGDFKRGDILIFKPPQAGAEKISNLQKSAFGLYTYRPFLIKRLIGLPGDRVRITQGVVYVNGTRLDGGFTTDFWRQQGCWDTQSSLANNAASDEAGYGILTTQPEITVPAGQYFVMGDNRTANGSEDSRLFGPVLRRDVAGRAAAVVWPIVRKENAQYDCASSTVSSLSGPSKLNWRVLSRPDAFAALNK